MIITYMQDGILYTNIIDQDELGWYLNNTTVYKVR